MLNQGAQPERPTGQITSSTRDNDIYAVTANINVNRPYVSNGLNQYTSAGPTSFTYDPLGRMYEVIAPLHHA